MDQETRLRNYFSIELIKRMKNLVITPAFEEISKDYSNLKELDMGFLSLGETIPLDHEENIKLTSIKTEAITNVCSYLNQFIEQINKDWMNNSVRVRVHVSQDCNTEQW